MFKKFIQRIIDAKNKEDAIQNVCYGTKWDENGKIVEYGIDAAYQSGKITAKEHEMLFQLIEKMANGEDAVKKEFYKTKRDADKNDKYGMDAAFKRKFYFLQQQKNMERSNG